MGIKTRAHHAASALAARHDRWAASYDEDTARYGWCAPARLHSALAGVRAPAASQRVLDVGVGTGQASAPFVAAGAQVTGLDVSAAMLARASAATPGFHHLAVHDLNQPFTRVGVTADRFDVIVSCGSMHYARDLGSVLGQLAGALAPAGVLAFTYIPPQSRPFSAQTQLHSHADMLTALGQLDLQPLAHEQFVAYYEKANPEDPVVYELVVAGDPRPATPLPTTVEFINRTACVDRGRVLAAAARNLPSPTTLPAGPAGAALCDVLVITAHPDDESVYMGATLSALRQRGYRIELVCLTNGAGGRGRADAASKAQQRAHELAAACHHLGVSRHQTLGFEDFGKYRDLHRSVPIDADDALEHWGRADVVNAIAQHIAARRPRVVLGFDAQRDPNYSLHGHHLAAGHATTLAVREAAASWAVEQQWAIEPATAGAAVVVRGNARAKLAAVSAHTSQRFSTTRLTQRLRDGDVASSTEHWHLVQQRPDVPAAHNASPLARLVGEPAFAVPKSNHPTSAQTAEPTIVRADIIDAMAARAKARRAAGPTLAAIEDLRGTPTQIVVTGQQVGLFGGPMYTLLKALAAVRSAASLRASGTKAVAVMWLASQDHDADEVARVDVLAGAREPTRLRLAPTGSGAPVGRLPLGDGIHALLDRFGQHIADAPSADQVMAGLREHYVPTATFGQAFAGWFGRLTDSTGLILLDPDDPAVANACAPLYRSVIERAGAITAALKQCFDDVSRRGSVPPVARGALRPTIPLLLIDDTGRRVALRRDGADFVSTTGRRYTAAELDAIADTAPQRLSPDVLLRPLCCSQLFGGPMHVLGPTEARYFEQTDALAGALGMSGCAFEHRASAAIASSASFASLARLPMNAAALVQHDRRDRLLGLHGLGSARQLVERVDALRTGELRELATITNPVTLAETTETIRSRIGSLCGQLAQHVGVTMLAGRIDDALATQVAAARAAIPGQPPSRVGSRRAAREASRLVSAALRHGRRQLADVVTAVNRLAPPAAPQERVLNVAQAIAEYGFALPELLLDAISLGPACTATELVEVRA